jgi:hypothetical protein
MAIQRESSGVHLCVAQDSPKSVFRSFGENVAFGENGTSAGERHGLRQFNPRDRGMGEYEIVQAIAFEGTASARPHKDAIVR